MDSEIMRILRSANNDLDTLRKNMDLEHGNRISLLVWHGIGAILVGAAFGLSGFTGYLALDIFPPTQMAHLSVGILLMVSGAILLMSIPRRHMPTEALGLLMLFGWYSLMALGFLLRMIEDFRQLPFDAIVFYPIFVYVGLAGIMAIHLVTLHKKSNFMKELNQQEKTDIRFFEASFAKGSPSIDLIHEKGRA